MEPTTARPTTARPTTARPTTARAAARPRGRRIVAAGVVAAGLSVAGAGAAMAVAPTSAVSQAVAGALHDAGVDWSFMPAGYTQAQYEAFWGAGYTAEDVDALAALWSTGTTETKAHAGQLILDGQELPFPPSPAAEERTDAGGTATTDGSAAVGHSEEQLGAFWGAGYTPEDLAALNDLWSSESMETKARAGQMILDGQTVPVAPGSTAPAAS
ncbi:hypothetical protein [Cellulomonas sp. NS3]|uniref:hypothetical protein n=1 Tax=Cellulomonas sp. NS3 TaxID=2973977 RepID=UPI002161C9B0|nr:hypothetical protein [Cellulomonas sp. NS3]